MTSEANELLKRALNLSVADRAELAGSLIESLDDAEDEAVKVAWEQEIVRRMKDFESGLPGIPLEAARRRLRSVVE